MIITDEASLVLNPLWVPHWTLFSLGIPCSVDFLSFSNFHIIWSIKFIFGDIWWSACLVFQFGSFLKSSERKCRAATCSLLSVLLPVSGQGVWWSAAANRSGHGIKIPSLLVYLQDPLSGDNKPVFCWSGFGSWAFPEAAKPVQGAVSYLTSPCSVHLLGHKVFVGLLSRLDFIIIPGGKVPLGRVLPLVLSYISHMVL